MQQIVTGIWEQLHGNAANASFLHTLLDGKHALSVIAHRILLTGQQQDWRIFVPAVIGILASGALHVH